MKADPNFVDILRRRAGAHPERMAYRFLDDGEEEGGSLTYAELDRRARALAAFLQREGAAGERALLLYPPGLDFVVGFLGCLYAGTVAVPAYPPRSNRPDSRLQAIARDARPRFALATAALRDRAALFVAQNPELAGVRWVATDEVCRDGSGSADSWERGPELTSEGVAFLQYTSGSTATPKGVVVRHGNLVHNEEMIRRAFGQSEESVIVGWLPLYHDMGLIGNVLQPLYVGGTCVLMAPVAFLQRPSRWLKAISRYRATGSGGPNFAYELCVRKVGPEEREGLDLSSWEVAYNGAEPVRAETMERFAESFAPHGFRREAFYPCYGLAEATLFVTGGERGGFPAVLRVDAEALERHRAQEARGGAPSRSLVSCGSAWLDQKIEIVDPETCRPLPEGQVGEVWISGPSVAGGYWNRPEESARTFGARLEDREETFLRTGDLGFLSGPASGGSLYLTGRAKDLIILRGRNLYPQDLELTAERSHGDLRPGCGAAFAVEVEGEERLVIVQEVERDAEKRWQKGTGSAAEVAEAVRRAVATEHEAAIHAVVLLRAGSVPKTSSGKIRRQSCRADFLAGNLEAVEQWTEGGAAAGEAPRTPTEEKLERIWAEVLGLERVGVERDLFELGADSLRATQLLARANEAFGVGLTIDALFGAPSIAELATLLDQGDVAAADVPLVPVLGSETPLSFAQRRLWFLHQLDPENPVHNIAASIRLQGRLDVAALSAVFDEVVRRHEALRTGFASPGEEPVQVVRPAAPLRMPVIDGSSLPLSRGGSARVDRERGPGGEGRLAAALARLPFSLETGPFLRVALVRFSPDEHELLLCLHHIASDGGSLAVLVREMGALYEAFAAGRPSPLADLPVQYADYAAWQRRRLDAGALEAGLAFWRRQLGGDLPVVELPADRPRPAVLSFRGAHCERLVPARLVERLEALAREGRATRFMALLAGFQALLHRYTGLDDLVVGTPIDGRNRVELEGLIGVFLNNLVLRTRLDGRPGFRELLARVRRTALDAYAHQEVPFERLVDELRTGRDLSRTPLFQVMFVGQNAPLKRLGLPGLELHPREVDLGTARFDLSLSLGEADGGWLGIWKYSTDLFEAATMERMAGHLESLLAAAAAEPDRPVALLPMLSAAERRQVVEVWNGTAAPFPDQATLHGLFAEQVRRTPDAIALEYGESRLTYAELSRRANRLARHLRRLGVGADALVGIAAERSIQMVVGLVGILEAGGAYVPVDPSYPQDRIAYMLEDSGVGVLLAQGHLEEGLPGTKATLVRLDEGGQGPGEGEGEGERDEEAGEGTGVRALPENLAYCIYTSGSTGRPKGAGIPHRGIVNRLNWMQSAYRLTADDRVLQKTPFSFDVSVWELFWPLLTGARLVMSPPGAHQDAARLAELIRHHGITTLHFVPSMLQIFLDQDGLAESCRSVRRVFASGEALPFPLKERFFERIPGPELHNLYGPTEASVDVTYHACKPGGIRQTVPIGRPIDNTSILILDRESQPVPVGVPGELHIGGVNLARGYLGRPELTAERFVPNPFGDGDRLYRTGDLARYSRGWLGGEIEYLGRLDFQVKIRGVRIELGEIEAELCRHPGVREACVLARADGGPDGGPDGGNTRLVAYLVPRGGDVPQTDELRSYLRGRLPEAMVPSAFVVLPAFPLNPSGKVDRRALPAPATDRPEMAHGFEEPRTELERRLAQMWRELLRVERVGIHDSFFELGGDSIQGAMFINRLQKELSRIVYVMSLFDTPTVASFAEYLATAYPDAVGRLGGEAAERQAGDARMELEPALEKLRAAVSRRLGRAPGAEPTEIETRPIPRAVFLLSPFRSGSTLLRVMLAGHPGVFAPPELELLAFRTMDERRDAYSGRNRFAVEGLLRAVMDLHGCGADRARQIVAEAEDEGLTVGGFFRRLQEWAGGRLVVDKTPSYALDLWTLRRAERLFDKPLYVHLVRHPRATVDSYLEAKMDQVYGFPFPPGEQAELVWTLAHRNILAFLEEVPRERRHRLRFEELVKDPRGSMQSLSRFLGLAMEEGMLQPYQGQRMTDGLHAGTRMMGDPKFHEHRGIDASVADRWLTAVGSLAPETWRLAAELGYPAPEAAPKVEEDLSLRPVPRTGEPASSLPLSFSQERLWFLTQLDPDSPAYNMPAAVLLEGALDVPALARSFGEVRRRHQVLRTVYPAVNGEPAQQVLPPTFDLPVTDLSALPEEAREGERKRLALAEGRRPFDLTQGPMLRTSLLRLGAQEHVLLLTMHHIASDGWTIGILIRELQALYTGAALPELPLQYADYAAWQRRWLDSSAMEQHLAYWRTRLSGRLPVLEMPTDRPRPALLTARGARLSRTVPSRAVEEVRAWSQKEGGTLFLTLLAAFNALLYRYTGQEDLLLGIPIANRNRLETENLIGFFLNMVVQRTDLSGDPAFRELLARVSEGFLGSTPHQEVPFEKLVEDLQPERDLSRTPIFQVQFSLQNTPTQALDLPGVSLKLLENHNRTTKFDFTVFLFDRPEGLTTTLEYNVDLYDEPTIGRLLRHWETLLAGSVAAPGLRLADLPMLAQEERAQLLTGWNTPAAMDPAGPSLHRLFEAQAAKHPKNVAAVHEVSELSYRKLNERANQLAWRLRAMGVGPETPVGLCVERSLDTIVGILGILKAGGAYVPLDPAYPAERLSWILENALSTASAPVLVTQDHLVERFLPAGISPSSRTGESAEERGNGTNRAPYPTVLLDRDRAGLAGESTENLADLPGMGPDNVAYVIYTSGSTGRPKGVPVTHANAVRLFTATERWFGFGPDDVWTVFHSFAFDFSVWEIWGALLHGGRLVVVPRETTMNPAAFYELLATEGVTVLSQTPSAFRQLIKADEEEGRGRLALEWVVFGGEALDLAALAPWIERHGDERPRLVNMYGITETTVHVTFRPVTRADLERPGASPVGEPIPDLQVHLLGTHGELLPVGVPGEIHVGGAGLARGYLGRPELTAERFVPDPFSPRPGVSPRPGARLYRSGDLARRRPDGDLDYLGRIDGQVKIRGFRIELGEIESALNRHPRLRESVVMAQTGPAGDRRLVAWVVPKAADVPVAELREHLLQTLPEYMVPAAFVSLETLPLTTHGKVDRRALPEPGSVLLPASELVAPRSRTEARLAEIWREVLRVEQVGVHDNFFELGGHSLLVSQLSSRVRNAFGVELPLRQVFEAPTLEALAARVEGVLPEKQERIGRAPRTGPLPLSFAQERLWFLDQLEPGSPLYNVPVSLRLKGRLDLDRFAATFREIVRRHEALRTSFGESDGKPVQVIEEDADLEIPFVDLSQSLELEAALARLAEEEARKPFDLRRAPLLRVQAVKLAEDEHAVLATLHHIVSDGWSLGVLVHEVAALYSGRTLPELPVQYADFAVWQRGRLTGELAGEWLETEVGHWRGALAGASTVLDLPTDHPRPVRQSFRGRHLPVELPAGLVDRMKERARQDGSTLFMTLLAGFQVLLHRYTGQEDFLVGSPVANRTREEIEPLIGVFVNTLALRARLAGDPAFGELVGRVKGVTLDAYAHQDLPFERLVEALEPQRDLSRPPLFQVLFVLQNAPFEPLALPELTLEPLELESGTSKFDLSLYWTERPDGRLGGFLEIDTALFEEATAHRLLEHFRILLESAAADPACRVSELALLSRAERRQVLKGWNGTAAELPETTVVSLFEEQARRTPGAVAVSQGETRLTYAELDERAEGLAAHLRSQGIGAESRVGISMERTPDMLVAVLGVLKSGAAYVPLDPSHPRERLELILEAAKPQTVITELGRAVAPSPAKQGRAGEGASLAYILFTSGSTGRPKGVQIPHRALINFLLSMAREPGLEPSDTLLAVTTLSFDIAGLELLLPLIVGARAEIATREEASDAELLKTRLAGATVMQATPATWRMLLDAGWEGGDIKALCGGEALPSDLAARLLPRVASLWNMYGPTETTIWSATRRVAHAKEGASIAVGGAIANTQLYVLDRRLQPVPVGVAGELCIGGEGLARGYLDAPDLTAERFVPDPFAGGRMYRTGDLVRWRPDGTLEFLGRIDFQVKVRGFRIELGEIEISLAAHPAVRQAVAGLRGDRLVAWFVADGENTEAGLREHLKGRLPEFMIPSAFVMLEAFPLTPSGKVDRRTLPEPGLAAGRRHLATVAPRGPVEELIAGIWCELLRVDRVGSDDSFFELGGHSLLATQLVSRLRRVFGVELPVRQLFEAPTLSRLAGRVQAARAGGGEAIASPIPRRSHPRPPRLSFGQERLWFLDRLIPGSAAYNISVALRLSGDLRVPALSAALDEVVRRHEVLRTTFRQSGGEPRQAIAPELRLPLPVLDLRDLPEAEREAEALRRLALEAERPFDLELGPLVRALLLRVGRDEWRGALVLHHIVADGWSTDVLVREMGVLYGTCMAGEPSSLPELSIQYADFAEWQRERLQGEWLGAQMAWWRERLAGVPPLLELPADRPRPAVQRYRGRDLRQELSSDLVLSLAAFCRAEGATFFMGLLTGFAALLQRYTGRADVVVGTPVAGRDREELEGLIGLFLNSLALRVGLAGDPGFGEALARTRETVLGAFANQELPFEKLVDELAPQRNLSHAPVYQVMLVLQNPSGDTLALPGVELSRIALAGSTSKLDLTLNAQEEGGRLRVRWLYNSDLFDAATISRLSGHLEQFLSAALAEPGRRLAELALLTPAEERQVREWNATARPYPADVCLHELIAAQAARTPDRPAVAFEGTTLSYGELDAAARRLARRLADLGVGPDVPVAVFAERSLEMVVALLGVLQAGGAYLPVDPDYPADRVAWMLSDSGVPVILAQGRLLDRLPEGLPEHGGRVISLDGAAAISPAGATEPGLSRLPNVEPSNLAYVIYTSGSTGRPKGTMNSHRGIVNRLLWMQEQYGLTAGDSVLQKTPFSFDVSVWEFFWPLMTGARLVVARPGGHQDPGYLVETIVSQGITTLHFVPSMLQVFLGAPGVERCASLRRVVCSGEALPPDLSHRFQERFPAGAAGLHNLYGPTEAAVDVTYWPCGREEGRASVPIGYPVANTQIRLLDANLQMVPAGVPGELHIGGVQLARGYLARPELTAEKFIPDPFGEPGARLYKTGDLARYLPHGPGGPDGAVDFLGRIDHQVKVRGLRIELGEIEAALAAHPAVREAVVLARSGGAALGDVSLAAYVTLTGGSAAPALAELRAALARHLPEHMLPSALVVLEALPLSPNGKADRKALARIAPEAAAGGPAGSVAPRNDLEQFLAGLFAEVLQRRGFGVHDSFFELGGNSITGAIFINRLQQELGEIVHVVTLFDHPTLDGLARFVAAEYPLAVERRFGPQALAGGRAGMVDRVDESLIAEVDRMVRKLGPIPGEIAALPRNPPAVFVLSPPRSGSTLLRVMLAGHPALFAPPELELLGFDTLAERRDAFPGRDAFRLEGLLRAVMEAWSCGPDEARERVEGWERAGLTTREAFRRLQERIGGRMLVDKTPTYAWDAEALRRAEAGFEEPRYIHLVRHPLGMVRSFEEARIDQIFFHEDHPWTRRELAEALWVLAQRNTLELLAEIPAGRRHAVLFEELLSDPERVLRGVCEFLGLEWDPAMADPYKPSSVRMTDGLHAESRMLGDVKFHQHGRVESEVAQRWRRELSEESLGDPARELAAGLGYPMSSAGSWTPIPRVEVEPGVPQAVSFAQERFWFLNRLDDSTAGTVIPAAVRLAGALRPDALSAALDEVVSRHATLRTRFAEQGGRPVQIALPPGPVPLPRIDLAVLPKAQAEAEARRLANRELLRPFDLSGGPLLRVLLLALPGGDHALLLAMHHIVSDGWSVGVLLREMGALYVAFARGEASPLPALPIQYTDFARWQRQELSGGRLESEVGYWRQRLAGLPRLELPVERRPEPGEDLRADALDVVLPSELAGRLKALARERGLTLFMTLLAGFHALLARHAGQDDVAVGSPVAGRNRAETEGLIGLFVNTLVLRGDLSGGPSFAGLLERERESVLGAFSHQDLPFALLVEALRPERRKGRQPFVDVLFSLQNQPMPRLELPGLTLERLGEGDGADEPEVRTAFSLSVLLWEAEGTLRGGLGFNSALFERATVERWRDNYLALLAAMADRPGQPVAEVPLLSVGERRQIVAAEPERPAAVSESVAKQRAELSSRRDHLSAAKRELLEKRLRGQVKGGAPAAGRPSAPKVLVPLQAGDGSRPPFFCIHAIGGSVFSYAELARALGPEQAFYGVQSPGLEGGRLFDGIPAMAAEYAAAVESAAPNGPVLLGGWSFGGVVAFEMGRQLRARGREVPLVALLDSYAPTGADLLAGRSDAELLRPLLRDQAGLQGRDAQWLDEMPVAGEEAVIRMLERAREAGVLRADVRSGSVERLLGVYKANLRALSSYRPQPYGGRVVLFRSEGAAAGRDAGWEGLSGEPSETQSVSGDHYSMLSSPHVVHLAQRLTAAIERALRESAGDRVDAGAEAMA